MERPIIWPQNLTFESAIKKPLPVRRSDGGVPRPGKLRTETPAVFGSILFEDLMQGRAMSRPPKAQKSRKNGRGQSPSPAWHSRCKMRRWNSPCISWS